MSCISLRTRRVRADRCGRSFLTTPRVVGAVGHTIRRPRSVVLSLPRMLFPEVRCNLCSIEAVARLWLFHCRPSCPVAWPATRVAGDRLKLYRQGAAVAAGR
eukprot:scaffold73951_cov43-Phaeocystis_antarctica.AAC.2